MKPRKFKVNSFWHLANEFNRNLTEEEEISKIDQTGLFWDEINTMIETGELVIININGKVRLGKSTAGIYIGQQIFKILQKNGHRIGETFSMNNIARDQQEKSKLMRDPTTQFTVLVTDESNELEKGGENASAESALNKVFSDVQAGRYVHQVACSPKELVDPNADILLEVVGCDKTSRTTHMNLYYRLFKGGQEYIQLLGYVNVCVHDLISIWEDKLKKVFLQTSKTRKEQTFVDYWIKKDFFCYYMIKKYEKMELITKHGINRPRMLDYAEVIIETVQRLQKLCKLNSVINHDIVRNYIKMGFRKAKIPTSIVGEELATREAMGILKLHLSYHRVMKELKGIKKKVKDPKFSRILPELEEELILRNDMLSELGDAIHIQEEELKRYKEVNERYNAHIAQ